MGVEGRCGVSTPRGLVGVADGAGESSAEAATEGASAASLVVPASAAGTADALDPAVLVRLRDGLR